MCCPPGRAARHPEASGSGTSRVGRRHSFAHSVASLRTCCRIGILRAGKGIINTLRAGKGRTGIRAAIIIRRRASIRPSTHPRHHRSGMPAMTTGRRTTIPCGCERHEGSVTKRIPTGAESEDLWAAQPGACPWAFREHISERKSCDFVVRTRPRDTGR